VSDRPGCVRRSSRNGSGDDATLRGFGARTFSAYAEAFPLSPGHQERVQLCQLYPLLVHLNLFGGGYLDSSPACAVRLLLRAVRRERRSEVRGAAA